MEEFFNLVGLQYFYNRIKTIFADKVETEEALGNKVGKVQGMGLSSTDFTAAEKTKLSNIETAADVNIIEEVQQNGVALGISGKTVNVIADANMIESIQQNGAILTITGKAVNIVADTNVIDAISVNGANVAPVSRRVNITFPTDLGGFTNTPQFQTKNQVDTAVAEAIGGISMFEFIIVDELPVTGLPGKIYLVKEDEALLDIYNEYAYIDGEWEKLGTTAIDLSAYWNTGNLRAITTAEIDSILV